jgi:hypothetical protein
VLRDVYRRVVVDELQWTVDEYHRAINAGVFDDRRVELL